MPPPHRAVVEELVHWMEDDVVCVHVHPALLGKHLEAPEVREVRGLRHRVPIEARWHLIFSKGIDLYAADLERLLPPVTERMNTVEDVYLQ